MYIPDNSGCGGRGGVPHNACQSFWWGAYVLRQCTNRRCPASHAGQTDTAEHCAEPCDLQFAAEIRTKWLSVAPERFAVSCCTSVALGSDSNNPLVPTSRVYFHCCTHASDRTLTSVKVRSLHSRENVDVAGLGSHH